jgi:hypothetical protein
MKDIDLDHRELRELVRFTDPFIHSPEKEEEILAYFMAGTLRALSLVRCGQQFLIFNGNHRVLVAIAHRFTITCRVLEDLDDVFWAQAHEDEHRDLSAVAPLTFESVVEELLQCAAQYGDQNPDDYSFNNY